jgi:type II secretory pathway pseudopilin PulG
MVVAGVAGAAVSVGVQVQSQLRMRAAEDAAAETLSAIREAQRVFRRATGGYATDLASLTRGCPSQAVAMLREPLATAEYEYRVVLRASSRAMEAGSDCHGKPTASDFYAAVSPGQPWAGRQAMAVTSRGRIYVFFDGIAPVERDMDTGGLAVPLDALDTFKIP